MIRDLLQSFLSLYYSEARVDSGQWQQALYDLQDQASTKRQKALIGDLAAAVADYKIDDAEMAGLHKKFAVSQALRPKIWQPLAQIKPEAWLAWAMTGYSERFLNPETVLDDDLAEKQAWIHEMAQCNPQSFSEADLPFLADALWAASDADRPKVQGWIEGLPMDLQSKWLSQTVIPHYSEFLGDNPENAAFVFELALRTKPTDLDDAALPLVTEVLRYAAKSADLAQQAFDWIQSLSNESTREAASDRLFDQWSNTESGTNAYRGISEIDAFCHGRERIVAMKKQLDDEVKKNAGVLGVLVGGDAEDIFGAQAFSDATLVGIGSLVGAKGIQVGVGGLGARGSGTSFYESPAWGTKGQSLGLGNPNSGGGNFGEKPVSGKASLAEDFIVDGRRKPEAISPYIQRPMKQMQYCYQRELESNPNLAGEVRVKFVIAQDGRVSQSEVQSTTLQNAKVEDCICNKLNAVVFPELQRRGETAVTATFVFAP